MALVIEETRHEATNVNVCVTQRQDEETHEAWRIISVEMDGYERITPREMRDLGRWLVRESKRIGRAYTSSGAPRKPNSPCTPARGLRPPCLGRGAVQGRDG